MYVQLMAVVILVRHKSDLGIFFHHQCFIFPIVFGWDGESIWNKAGLSKSASMLNTVREKSRHHGRCPGPSPTAYAMTYHSFTKLYWSMAVQTF